MTDIEQEARAEKARKATTAEGRLEYHLLEGESVTFYPYWAADLRDVIRRASRSASPASAKQVSREAVARLLCEAEDSGTYTEDEGTCTWHLDLADRLLAAFTITARSGVES